MLAAAVNVRSESARQLQKYCKKVIISETTPEIFVADSRNYKYEQKLGKLVTLKKIKELFYTI